MLPAIECDTAPLESHVDFSVEGGRKTKIAVEVSVSDCVSLRARWSRRLRRKRDMMMPVNLAGDERKYLDRLGVR